MAISLSYSLSFLLILFLSFLFQFSEQSQFIIASDQIKLWSENVVNKMPKAIMNKLSPLTKKDCDYFIDKISKNDEKFKADSGFCSLAHLACSSLSKNSIKKDFNTNYAYDAVAVETNKNVDKLADPNSFFRVSKLKNGNVLHLPNLEQSLPIRSFLPYQIASKISLTSSKEITKIFPYISNTKILLDYIESSISSCNAKAINGEIKSCPKSLEELISFSKLVLGGKKLISLTSESTKGSNSELKIEYVKKFDADNIVACHELFFPFATYYCHSISLSNLYKVDFVEAKTGAPVNSMLAICHMDTSTWSADHVAFHILKFSPGQGEACHWFSQIDLAWIAADKKFV